MTLVLSLLPLGVLSMVQTRAAMEHAQEMTLNGIGGATLEAARPQIDAIRDARVTARVLAARLAAGPPDAAGCVGLMQAVAEGIPSVIFVAFVGMDGQAICSSTGKEHDFARHPLMGDILARAEPAVVYHAQGPVSGLPVIGVGHPVIAADGVQAGVVAISIPHQAVESIDYSGADDWWEPMLLATFTREGVLLAASIDQDQATALLPEGQDWTGLAALAGHPVMQDGPGGQAQIVSVTRIASGLYLLGLWQREKTSFWRTATLAPFLLPALTWAAALIAAGIASDRLVVRHVRALSRAMEGYRATRARRALSGLNEAPTEIKTLNRVYDELIQTIEQDEAELQNLVVDKDVLLKEVHHRSGNSLQIIASIMRMYRRETPDTHLRTVLDGLINRVIALSSTHTSLYSQAGRRDVPMDEILNAVVRRLKEIHGIPLGVATKRFQPIQMPVKAAVPLALALAEIAGCYFAGRTGLREGAVEIALNEVEDEIRLTATGPAVAEFSPETTTGIAALPQRMLMQYALQLRSRLTVRIEGDRSFVELAVPRSAG